MKKILLSPWVVYPLITAGVIADYSYKIEWAGNIALFALWLLVVLTFTSLFVDSKALFKNDKKSIGKYLFFLCLIVQIAAGWIVIAVFSFIAWLCFFIKKSIYKDELDKAA